MATKKTTPLGPKAQLMKKSVDQLKRKAKQLKIQGYSTKKKEQLVNSIMMAEARAKRKPGTRKKKVTAKKVTAKKPAAKRMTRAAIGTNWGSMRGPKMTMVKPKVKMRRPTMSQSYYYEADFNGFGYRELDEAGKLLSFYAADPTSALTPLALDYFGAGYSGSYVKVGFNANSGNVFLIDEDYNVIMPNKGKLDLFITTPYSGEEGFYDDLMDIYDELDEEDQEYLDGLK